MKNRLEKRGLHLIYSMITRAIIRIVYSIADGLDKSVEQALWMLHTRSRSKQPTIIVSRWTLLRLTLFKEIQISDDSWCIQVNLINFPGDYKRNNIKTLNTRAYDRFMLKYLKRYLGESSQSSNWTRVQYRGLTKKKRRGKFMC